MKQTIVVLSSTRAEYGLLRPVIKKLNASDYFEVRILVTGAHLSNAFGLTVREIEDDGYIIDKKVSILLQGDSSGCISKSMGLALIGFGEYFDDRRPDFLIVLGDRYETLAVCCAAMNARVPIIHLHGGETTEGAIDEAIRHSITKMSLYHFTSTEEYRKRVIQLGESPENVFNVGATGVENVLKEPKYKKEELECKIGMKLDRPYGVVTFHPVTLEGNCIEQCKVVMQSMSRFNDFPFIITGANADCGGKEINRMLQLYADENDNICFVQSLGMKGYLSALEYASFVMGNSSSGIIEAPSFGIPTINIGNRQKGRIQARTVINCRAEVEDIVRAINLAMSTEFQCFAKKQKNPYGDGNTSDRILNILEERVKKENIDLKKSFYNLNFEIV